MNGKNQETEELRNVILTMNNQIFMLYSLSSCLSVKINNISGLYHEGKNQAVADTLKFISDRSDVTEGLLEVIRKEVSQIDKLSKTWTGEPSPANYLRGYRTGMEAFSKLITDKYLRINLD